MQVQSTSPFDTTAASTAAASSSAASAGTTSGTTDTTTNPLGAPTEATFLQLLVAQMQYQDPTQPQDPTAFVSELAQFSELNSVLGIQQNTDTIVQDMSSAGATTAPVTTPTTPTPVTTPSTTQSAATTAA